MILLIVNEESIKTILMINQTYLKNDVIDKYSSKDCSIPKITELYSLLFKNNKCYRSPEDKLGGFVGIGKKNNKWREEFYNIGMKAIEMQNNLN